MPPIFFSRTITFSFFPDIALLSFCVPFFLSLGNPYSHGSSSQADVIRPHEPPCFEHFSSPGGPQLKQMVLPLRPLLLELSSLFFSLVFSPEDDFWLPATRDLLFEWQLRELFLPSKIDRCRFVRCAAFYRVAPGILWTLKFFFLGRKGFPFPALD